MIMQLVALILVFVIATAYGISARIRWANAKRYNMPASQHPAFVAAHPGLVVPRPWSWRVTYGAAFAAWVVVCWMLWR